jgi:hypothetical protein
LEDAANSRAHILAVFNRFPGHHTFADMRKIVAAQCADLKNDDKYLRIELSYLDNVIEQVTEAHIRSSVVNLFPTGAVMKEDLYEGITAAIDDIRRSMALAACSVTLAQDIDVVHKLVYNLSEGASPSNVDSSQMSEWFAKIMARAENFCRHAVANVEPKTALDSQVVLYGKEALIAKFDQFQKLTGLDKDKATKELKQFRWMLTAPQKALLQDAVNAAVIAARNRCLHKASIADITAAAQALVPFQAAATSGAASSSGSKMLTMAPDVLPHVPFKPVHKDIAAVSSSSSGGKQKLSDADLQRNSMLQMFKKGKIASA